VNYRRDSSKHPQPNCTLRRLSRISQHDQVIIGCGRTNVLVAQYLPADLRATIITNSPTAAVALKDLSNRSDPYGGRLYQDSLVTVGAAPL
jgi:DeoR/GlpR family transcriptional regulator of sugar metabolism